MDEYLAQCERFGGGPENLAVWRELRTVLGERRNGWTFETLNSERSPEIAWRFGLAGAARLVVTVELQQVVLYEAERDEEQLLPTVDTLAVWLDENEARYEGFTPLQEELMDYLLPLQVEKWATEEQE